MTHITSKPLEQMSLSEIIDIKEMLAIEAIAEYEDSFNQTELSDDEFDFRMPED